MGKDGLFRIEIQIDRTLAHFGSTGDVIHRHCMIIMLKEDFTGRPQDVIAALRLLTLPARGCSARSIVKIAALRHITNTLRHDRQSLFDYKSVYAFMTHLVKTKSLRNRLVNLFAKNPCYTEND